MKVISLSLLALAACAHGAAPLQAPDGSSFALDSARGHVVLLDFFATWCEPCKASLPAAQHLADRLAPRGFRVYAVDTERKSDAALFLKELNVTLPWLRDADGVQAEALGGQNLPFAVLLDRNGKVRWSHQGLVDEGTLSAEVEKLLAEGGQ